MVPVLGVKVIGKVTTLSFTLCALVSVVSLPSNKFIFITSQK
jgi:hypothetical protein